MTAPIRPRLADILAAARRPIAGDATRVAPGPDNRSVAEQLQGSRFWEPQERPPESLFGAQVAQLPDASRVRAPQIQGDLSGLLGAPPAMGPLATQNRPEVQSSQDRAASRDALERLPQPEQYGSWSEAIGRDRPIWRDARTVGNFATAMLEEALTHPVQFAADMAPGIGDLMALGYGVKDALKGDYGLAALNAASLIPGVPGGARAAGKIVKRNLKKEAIRGLRDLPLEEAMDLARRGGHLKQDPRTGQFVGAPRGITSQRALHAMRKRLDEAIERGVEGGDWYHRAQAGTLEVTGSPAQARGFADEQALWSAQSNPDANLGFALTGHNAAAIGGAGAVPRVRTKAQTKKFVRSITEGGQATKGPKVEPYFNKLDPTIPSNHIPVNDIWHFRTFGYKGPEKSLFSSGGTQQMHAFVDAETLLAAERANARRLGGRTDWDAGSVQAAPWVYNKGKSLHQRFPKRFPTLEDGYREAAKTYNDHFPKYTASATYESVPGAGTGHLPEIQGGSRATREAYTDDPRSSWEMEDGRDALYAEGGIYTRPTIKTTGAFTNPEGVLEVNPGRTARPLVSLGGNKGNPRIGEPSRTGMQAAEQTRAYLDAQVGGAFNKAFPLGDSPSPQVKHANAFQVALTRPITPEEMLQVAELAKREGYHVAESDGGLSFMRNTDDIGAHGRADGQEIERRLKGGLADDLAGVLPDGNIRRAKVDADYRPTGLDGPAGTGQATASLLKRLDDPEIARLVEAWDQSPVIRQKAQDRFERDAQLALEQGMVVREDIQRARQIIAAGGFTALRDALKAGVALPALGMFLLRDRESAGPPAPDGRARGDNASAARVLRRYLFQPPLDLVLREPHPPHHHSRAVPDVGGVVQRTGFEEDEVRAHADGHGAERVGGAEVLGHVPGAGLQDLPGGEPGRLHDRDLAMDREAGDTEDLG